MTNSNKKWIYGGVILVLLVLFVLMSIDKKVGGKCSYKKFLESFTLIDIDTLRTNYCKYEFVSHENPEFVMNLENSEFYNSKPLFPIYKWQIGDQFILGGSKIMEGSCKPLMIDTCKFIKSLQD